MRRIFTLAALLTLGTFAVSPVAAQITAAPTLVNFQGRLATPSGNPVPNGTYSIRFSLWNVASGGTAAANEKWNQTIATVQVRNGTFAVLLNVSTANLFNGNLWLEIKIGADAALTPRQQIVTVPYAFKANSVVDGSITSASIANGTITTADFAANIFNPLAWLLGGNSATNPATNFLGTTDNQPLNLRVNNRRAMQYSYAENTATAGSEFRSMNILGGSELNSIGAGVVGATIAGGGKGGFNGTNAINDLRGDFGVIGGGSGNFIDTFAYAVIAGGAGNIAQGNYSVISGGRGNNIQSEDTTIGGGNGNYAFGANATIGGGTVNSVTSTYSTIAGGLGNTASGLVSTIGGGGSNTASGSGSTIGGGQLNATSGYESTIAGGIRNTASGGDSTISGGYGNQAAALYSMVPGGNSNVAAGRASFAAGNRAYANNDGSFVWADNHDATFASTAADQFCIRAYGGMMLEMGRSAFVFTSSTAGEKNRYLELYNSPQTSTASGLRAGGILCADSYGYANPGKNDMVVKGTLGVGYNDVGGFRLAVNGSTFSLAGYTSSDARYKKNIAPLGNALESILNLRGVSYDWDKAKFPNQNFGKDNQMGFIAQEIEQIFPQLVMTAPDGYKAVNYIGVIPVLVEAVKTLKKDNDAKLKQKDAEIADLRAKLDALAEAVRELQNNRK